MSVISSSHCSDASEDGNVCIMCLYMYCNLATMCTHTNLHENVSTYVIPRIFFSELESNTNHSQSTNKSKRKNSPILHNPALQHLQHYVNSNFHPDFHRDGKI